METDISDFLKMVMTYSLITYSLGQELLTEADNIEDLVLRIIERFTKHPSVVATFENHKDNAFSFTHVLLDEIT